MAHYKEDIELLVDSRPKAAAYLQYLSIWEEKRKAEIEVLKRQTEKSEELVAEGRLLEKKIEDHLSDIQRNEEALSQCERKLKDLKNLVEKPKVYEKKGMELEKELRILIFQYKLGKKEDRNTSKKQQVEKAQKDRQSLAGEDLLKPHNEDNSTKQKDVKQSVSGAAPRPKGADMRSVRTDLQQPAPVAACTTLTGAATDTPSVAPAVPAGRKANR
jgi:hypothetical protein